MPQSKVNQQEKIFSALDWAAVKYFVKAAWLVRISVNPKLLKGRI
jgi:hypothetical protein